MCPGLTSKGAKMDINLPEKSYVAIRAEGKEHILSVGLLLMSTDDMYLLHWYHLIFYSKKINKGHGVENIHHLNDPLWKLNLANKDV